MEKRRDYAFAVLLAFLTLVLFFVPTGFQRSIYFNAEGVKVLVLDTDDSTVVNTGLFRQGEQRLRIRFLSGSHEGEEADAINMLSGSLKDDKMFVKGNIGWALMDKDREENVVFVNMVDHYRLSKELALVLMIAAIMVLFSGFKGLKTVLSFVFALMMLWKVMIPLSLKGFDPMVVACLTLLMISFSTLFLVGGVGRTALSAFIGTVATSAVVFPLSGLLTAWFGIHGSVLEMSEAILYAGFYNLDLTRLFSAVIVLSAGGAVMDLSIDVSASMHEVAMHSRHIDRQNLFLSGLVVGRAGVGTQMTTLLLAYMGSFLTVLMVYMAQSTPLLNVLTSKSIASEIVQSAVGMLSLVAVVPITAFAGSMLMKIEKTTEN